MFKKYTLKVSLSHKKWPLVRAIEVASVLGPQELPIEYKIFCTWYFTKMNNNHIKIHIDTI